jgi:hypothetical protein
VNQSIEKGFILSGVPKSPEVGRLRSLKSITGQYYCVASRDIVIMF